MDWGQVAAFAGVVVIVAGAQLAFMRQYVDKTAAEIKDQLGQRIDSVRVEVADLRGEVRVLDRDVQAVATKAHDH